MSHELSVQMAYSSVLPLSAQQLVSTLERAIYASWPRALCAFPKELRE